MFYGIVVCALVGGALSLLAQRGGPESWPLAVRFATASFVLFNLISGVPWIVWPGGTLWHTAHIPLDADPSLTIAAVQVRGAFEIVFALLALAASGDKSRASIGATMGLLTYTLFMFYEALDAQFTAITDPGRWLLDALMVFWMCGFGFQFFATGQPKPVLADDRPSIGPRIALGLCAAWCLGFGGWLYVLQPAFLIGYPEIIRHSAHTVGAEYLGLGVCAAAAAWESRQRRRIALPPLLLAGVAVASIAAVAGVPAPSWGGFQRLLLIVHLGLAGGLFAAWRFGDAQSLSRWVQELPLWASGARSEPDEIGFAGKHRG